jgi:hypothetical protein
MQAASRPVSQRVTLSLLADRPNNENQQDFLLQARRSALPRQQPRTTRIIAERLFYATIGYQRMQAVISDHKEGYGQGARLPATRQRAQG